MRQVADKLGLDQIASRVVTVAGTNGKGSTVAAYETWLHQSGYRVASYTSPHLLRYNERIKYALEPVADKALCEAFAQVENARGEIALTYFEYGTLAALYLMRQWRPDFAILEVGLGGRLDAVNIIDADLASVLCWGFPSYTGGVLSYIDSLGIREFIRQCEQPGDHIGDPLEVSEWLHRHAEQNDRVYPTAG